MRIFILFCVILCSLPSVAAQCDAVFPNVIQSHANEGRLTLANRSTVNDAPSAILPFTSGSMHNNSRCGSVACSVSGVASAALDINSEFPGFSGTNGQANGAVIGQGNLNTNVFNQINVGSGSNSFSDNYSAYYINNLNISAGATLNFKPGVYWIKNLSLLSSNQRNDIAINVVGSGTVYLYADNVIVENNRSINGLSNSAALNLGSYRNITFERDSQGEGMIYALGDVTLENGAKFSGVISAKNVTLNNAASVNYIDDLFDQYDFSDTCSNDTAPSLRAFYQFNQTGWSGTGAVPDSSGNGFNGNALGGAVPLSYSAGSCKVLDIPGNISSSVTDAIDAGIDLNDVGNQGSISFWYRSDQSWADNTARQLIDASNQAPSPDKYFYMSLKSGALTFAVEDSQDTDISVTRSDLNYAANQWVHITAVWDLPNNLLQLYVLRDGSGTVSSVSNPSLQDQLGDMDTLYIGDSRSNYFVNDGSGNSANGQFEDLRMHNYVLSQNEVQDFAGSEPSCDDLDPQLVAHWPMNMCSLNGDANEVIDVIAGANGTAIDGANISQGGKLCQSSEYAGEGEHINIPHNSAFAMDDGSLSMWFQVDDLSHQNDSTRDALVLFSKDSSGTNDGGDHLTIYVSQNGSINALHQSNRSSFYAFSGANVVKEKQWHHLVYTFGQQGMKVYLDKVQVARKNYRGGLSGNPEPIILGSGAWRTGDNISEPEKLTDHFIGKIDDVRLYQGQLDQAQVNNLFDEQEVDCVACPSNDVLEAHWPLDVCSLSGASDELVDVINGYNGAAVDGGNISQNGKFCQSGDFNGQGEHFNIPSVSAFETDEGALSFWFNSVNLGHTYLPDQGGQTLFSRDSNGFDNGGHLTLRIQATGRIAVRHQDTRTNHEIETGEILSANNWYHLAYTWGANGMRLYINGELVGQNRSYIQGTRGNTEPLIFGANAARSGNNSSEPDDLRDFFKGQIDEIKFFSNQIDTVSVTELFQQQSYTCTTCDNDQLVAQYQFEQTQWLGAGSVLDNSGYANHATPLGNALPINPSVQKACRAMEVPASDNRTGDSQGIDSNVDINALGNSGSISFWYRSNERWDSGNPRQLFDASTDLGDYDRSKYFYLAINADGKLDFNMEDAQDRNFGASTALNLTYPAEQWVHVAVTWNLPGQQLAIYLDGSAQTLTSNSDRNLTGELGELDTLYIGDNRSDYIVVTSTQNSGNGEFDDVRIYNFMQDQDAVQDDKDALATCSFVHKYLIEHDGSGLTCEAEPITIYACANESCSQLYDQDVTVNMNPTAGWPDGGQVTILANTPATVTLSQLEPVTVNLDVLDQTSQCSGTPNNSCSMTFSDAGFQFIGASSAEGFSDQIAESDFIAGQLRAVKTDSDSADNVCVAALTGEQDIGFLMSCDNPDACLTPIQTPTGNITSDGVSQITLNFDDNGIAPLTGFSYADAGQISMSVLATLNGNIPATGSTQFVVMPERILVTTPQPSTFVRAAADFVIEVSARGSIGERALPNYQPGNIQIALNRLGPLGDETVNGNFTYAQSTTIAASPSSVFSSSVITATGSGITNTNGVYSFIAKYSEFGQLSLDLRDTDYFNRTITSGPSGASVPAVLGVFIPAYYAVAPNTPKLSNTCEVSTGFTYLGQPQGFEQDVELSVSAMNADQQIMQNFDDDSLWTWLAGASASDMVYDDGGLDGTISQFSSPSMQISTNGVKGSRRLTLFNSRILYSKSDSQYGPFDSALDISFLPAFLTDNSYGSAAICYHQQYDKASPDDCDTQNTLAGLDDTNNVFAINNIAGSKYRWGRLKIDNGFGPENRNLLLPVSVEYFNGSSFVRNLDDSCTIQSLEPNDFNLFDKNGAATGSIAVLTSSFGMTSGKTLGFEGIKVTNVDSSLMGEYRIELLPRNDNTITWDDYLQFDWNGPDAGVGNPGALITFGQYRGNDKVIHWREVTN
ncbi:DUF6701 domain-containing protein [Aliiglaciecola sp. LCG003]|uniref:DUF6701 domain-containing protein n=1 Tax=Aliiglaciecola sp. LCG003 TaxID=3053655 RepID=UPI002572A52F|nr:DUF6701 domain-containing protein [Aliiglaciecola sp. LCG003]WJG09715.1 LamG domain-containing protein [Aliiglaciecola sp. LCG003]